MVTPSAPAPLVETADARLRLMQHWRRVRQWTQVLLGVWLLVTLAAPALAPTLNRWTVFGCPLGFWLCAEGAILGFLVLVGLYAWAMDRLDAAWPQP